MLLPTIVWAQAGNSVSEREGERKGEREGRQDEGVKYQKD
jgi:hypothetical protein